MSATEAAGEAANQRGDSGRPARAEEVGGAPGFSIAFTVEQSPREVFDAINNVRGWWSGAIDGRTDQLGAEFTYRYQELHRSRQRITELLPEKKVVWQVVEAWLGFVADQGEWNGTRIVFDITRRGDRTEVRFTHVGLVPAFQCYGECAGAWAFFINESLRSLITLGQGAPLARGA